MEPTDLEPVPTEVADVPQEEPLEPVELESTLAAEALAAVLGVLPSRPVSENDKHLATLIPAKLRRGVRKFLRGTQEAYEPAPELDTNDILEQLTNPVEELPQIVPTALVAEPLRADVMNTIARAREFLIQNWPTVILQSVVRPDLLEPSPIAKAAAEALFRVVDEPLTIIDEMCMRTLEERQVACLAVSYPQISEMLTALIWEEITKLPKDAVIEWDQEMVLRMLWNIPPDQAISTPRKGSNPPTKALPDPKSLQTRGQRLGQ